MFFILMACSRLQLDSREIRNMASIWGQDSYKARVLVLLDLQYPKWQGRLHNSYPISRLCNYPHLMVFSQSRDFYGAWAARGFFWAPWGWRHHFSYIILCCQSASLPSFVSRGFSSARPCWASCQGLPSISNLLIFLLPILQHAWHTWCNQYWNQAPWQDLLFLMSSSWANHRFRCKINFLYWLWKFCFCSTLLLVCREKKPKGLCSCPVASTLTTVRPEPCFMCQGRFYIVSPNL